MGQLISNIMGIGGEVSSDKLTATSADVLKGKTAVTNDSNDEAITGTLELTGNAGTGDVLESNTFYNTDAKTKLTGTMTNRGAVTSSLNAGGSYTIPAGYHNGSGKVTANSLSSQTSGTAAAANILSGKTAYVNGSKITGTMTNHTGTPNKIKNRRLAHGRFEVAVDAGYHGCYWNGNSYEYMELSEVASTLGLTAAKLAQGQKVCGLTGTYKGLGNATAADVLSGKTFSTASLSNAKGTNAIKAAHGKLTKTTVTNGRKQLQIQLPAGFSTISFAIVQISAEFRLETEQRINRETLITNTIYSIPTAWVFLSHTVSTTFKTDVYPDAGRSGSLTANLELSTSGIITVTLSGNYNSGHMLVGSNSGDIIVGYYDYYD